MPLSGSDLLLWVIGMLAHLVLLSVLLLRHRTRHFPVFVTLISVSLTRSLLLLYLLLRHEQAYRAAYLGMNFVDLSLQLALVYELASYVFRPLGRWTPDTRWTTVLLAAGSLLLASLLTWLAAPVGGSWEKTLILKAGFFSSSLLSELFLGMLALSVTVGLPWRAHVARIAYGLGTYSILDVAIEAAHTVHGAWFAGDMGDVLTLVRKTVYLLCVGYWIVTLWQEEPDAERLSPETREDLYRLQARLAYDLRTLRNWRKP